MGATAKGYALGRTLASACLQIVHDLAVVPVQDRAPKGEESVDRDHQTIALPMVSENV